MEYQGQAPAEHAEQTAIERRDRRNRQGHNSSVRIPPPLLHYQMSWRDESPTAHGYVVNPSEAYPQVMDNDSYYVIGNMRRMKRSTSELDNPSYEMNPYPPVQAMASSSQPNPSLPGQTQNYYWNEQGQQWQNLQSADIAATGMSAVGYDSWNQGGRQYDMR
jgi:hypothetical protein